MIRIALRMLLGDTTKWLGVVLGVFFCTFLITHLLSMVAGMMARTHSTIADIPEADVWVMDAATEYIDETAGMPSVALDRVRSVEGVAWAMPLCTTTLRARLSNGVFRAVALVGVDDATLLGAPRDVVDGEVEFLRQSEAVIVDEAAAESLLRVPVEIPARRVGWNMPDLSGATRAMRVGDELLLNDHRARVVGLARLSPRFISRATAYTTYARARAMMPPQRHTLSYVLVKAARGVAGESLAAEIQARTGLRARTRDQFARDTEAYYWEVTGVIARIVFMVGVATIVGACVSGLLLYVFTHENSRYYATFKALGAGTRTILGMVVAQAALSGVVGLGLGVGLSAMMGLLITTPAMPYLLTTQTLAFTAVTVLLVTTFSAGLSTIKVARLEPARVFNT